MSSPPGAGNAAETILDARGLNCPLPILRTKEKLQTMDHGQTLEILATDPDARTQIPDYIDHAGHRLLAAERDEAGVDHYLVEKG